MSDFPNKQGAFIGEGVSTARDIESTFDGEAFPFSARRGTALTLTANTTQIGFQQEIEKGDESDRFLFNMLKNVTFFTVLNHKKVRSYECIVQ